jgi:MFS family permease
MLGFTSFVFGLAFGPVVGAPISETLGRRAVYLYSMPVFALFTLGAGFSKNIETLIICRFFAGLFGGPVLAIGAGTNADIFPPEKRAITTVLYCSAAFMATGVGPAVASYATSRENWRWSEWIMLIFTSTGYMYSLFQSETYKKTILQSRAKRPNIPCLPSTPTGLSGWKLFTTVTLLRPIHMLLTESIVLSFSIYIAFNFAVLFSFLPAIPLVFTDIYRFNDEQSGLPFLGLFVGCAFGIPTAVVIDRILYQPKQALALHNAANGIIAPEHRLYGAMIGSFGVPIGLFWFGWSAHASTHWMVPTLALIPFAWGNLSIFVSAILYTVDTYQAANGASAMAANGLMRYIIGAVFPLCSVQMYTALGYGWASSLLGFVAVALLPVPWVLFYWGKIIRNRSGYDTIMA